MHLFSSVTNNWIRISLTRTLLSRYFNVYGKKGLKFQIQGIGGFTCFIIAIKYLITINLRIDDVLLKYLLAAEMLLLNNMTATGVEV